MLSGHRLGALSCWLMAGVLACSSTSRNTVQGSGAGGSAGAEPDSSGGGSGGTNSVNAGGVGGDFAGSSTLDSGGAGGSSGGSTSTVDSGGSGGSATGGGGGSSAAGAGGTSAGGVGGTSTGGSAGSSTSGGSGTGGTGGGMPCGNGKLDDGETCDGDCPTFCVDPDRCTSDVLSGSADTCDAECSFKPIVICRAGDGCCPDGCAKSNDTDCQPDVMVIGADPSTTHVEDVATALSDTGLFGSVTTFDARNAAVPTPTQLQSIEAVLVLVFGGLVDPAPLGDALADYHDAGGKVVLTNGANCHQTYRLRGRFEDEGYHVLQEGGVYPNPDSIGEVLVPDSPLMAGVGQVDLTSVHCAAEPAAGVRVVATYETTGAPAILVGEVNGHNRVDVNVYIASGGDLETPGVLTMLTNALLYPSVP